MSNIRVDVGYTINDGTEIKFRSPVDCSAITGMIVYYPGADGSTISKVFALADAHGNNVGDIDHLFAEDVVVKVILDVTKGMAYVQNADTNAYLEGRFNEKAPAGFGLGTSAPYCADCNAAIANGWYSIEVGTLNKPSNFNYAVLEVSNRYDSVIVQKAYNHEGYCAIRVYDSDTWGEWEWENPPMIVGVEYRTTERWEGRPVYVKYFDFGNLPNNNQGYLGISISSHQLIRASALLIGADYKEPFPANSHGGNPSAYWWLTTGGTMFVKTAADYSSCTATFTLWYIK